MKRAVLILLLAICVLPAMTVAQESPCPAESGEPWGRVVLKSNAYLATTQMALGLLYLGSDEDSQANSLGTAWQHIAVEWDESAFPDDLAVLEFAGTRLADAMVYTLNRIVRGDVTDADKAVLAVTIGAYQDALIDVGFGDDNCTAMESSNDPGNEPATGTAAASAQQTIAAQEDAIAEMIQESEAVALAANDVATAQAITAAAQATVEAQAAGIEPTANALSTQQAVLNATATVLGQQIAQGSIDPTEVELSIDVDYNGLINGDQDAIDETTAMLAGVLAPYEGCQVGLSLTFGWSSDLQTGIAVAQAVNRILADDFPKTFGDAALEDFASLQDPPGRVDLELFFYKGCETLGT